MKFPKLFSTALKLLGERSRRAWVGRTRAHIEFKSLHPEEFDAFTHRVREAAAKLVHVRTVEINPHTRRVVISFEERAYSLPKLVRLVEDAEQALGVDTTSGFDDWRPEHPADVEGPERVLLELTADVVGLLVGSGLKWTPLSGSRVAGGVASVLAVVRSTPRLRRSLDERFGPQRADLAMGLVTGLSLGFAQRPVSSLVEVAHKASLYREARGRTRLWRLRESDLSAVSFPLAGRDDEAESRPCPLPFGPIEEYSDRAWLVSLSGFAVSFLTTRNFQRAVAALFGGLPKPARLGRDVFSAEFGHALATRGVLVMDPDALRRLDRVDCLVLQGDLVARDRYEVAEIVTDAAALSPADARDRADSLFDADHPIEIHRQDRWTLGPPQLLGAQLTPEMEEAARRMSQRGGLVVGLMRDRAVVALIELKIIPQTGIDELIAAAHEAQMRVVIASNDEEVLQGLPADDTIPEHAGMRAGIRRLQREGRVVALVATGDSPAITAADCSIGLTRSGQRPPWGAHIICREDLSDVRFMIQACVAARKVSKQSVNIALGAATVGALVSAGGLVPLTTRRVIVVVNTASLIAMLNGARGAGALARTAVPAPRDRTPWHALDPEGVLRQLEGTFQGLSRREVSNRGKPAVAPRHPLSELGEAVTDELFSPLAPLLAAGAGLSAAVGSMGDAAMVGGVVVLNALVGGVQRFRTERAIRDLARSARRQARVLRSGNVLDIDASQLVSGDIVLLGPGEVVPADCRILECESLEVDASSLTGESLPVKKNPTPSFALDVADRSSMLYEGTSIASGHAKAIVVAVGDDTEARRGAAGSRRDPIRTGVERRLRSLIDMTGPIALGAGVGVVSAGLLRGRKLEDLVGSGVSLAVASVPEGLPLLATAAQLAAAERLSRRGALVRNVRSIEALGRVDVLCVDKTGTVTEGRIELSAVSDGATVEGVQELAQQRLSIVPAALRATPDSRHSGSVTDPTDAALLRGAARLAARPDDGCPGWRRLSELAFEAGRGYHAVLAATDRGSLLSVKGAPEAILPRCSRWKRGEDSQALDAEVAQQLYEEVKSLARRGLRVLAVAERTVDSEDRLEPSRLVGLTFVGLLAFSDPVRPSAAASIKKMRGAGVETVMITGDHPSTAEAIASELDLLEGRGVLAGGELSKLSDDELDARIDSVSVFARVTPSQKVRVVRALQRRGHVVAMVGDGANDAPAIRLANVGIAIGEQSTSAARSAADIVLTDERIETLVHAISEGRAMWASVRDAVSILIGGNLGEIGFTMAGGLVDGRPPLNARQLLLVNLLTDVAPAMAIALRPPTQATLESLANEGPDASLGQPLNQQIAARATVTAVGAGAAWLTARAIGSRRRASTVGLLALVGTQLGQTLQSGGSNRPVVVTSVASAAVLAAIVQTPGLSGVFGCKPIGPLGWSIAVGSSAGATYFAHAFPDLITKVMHRLNLERANIDDEPEMLPRTSERVSAGAAVADGALVEELLEGQESADSKSKSGNGQSEQVVVEIKPVSDKLN